MKNVAKILATSLATIVVIAAGLALASSNRMNISHIGGDSANGVAISPKTVNNFALTTTTPSGSPCTSGAAIDWSAGNVQALDLNNCTGNATITWSGQAATGVYTLVVTQDATAARTLTFPSSALFAGGTAPYTLTVTTTGNAVDIVTCVTVDATHLYCTVSQDHK